MPKTKEKAFPCECGKSFENAALFSNHIGQCKVKPVPRRIEHIPFSTRARYVGSVEGIS